MTSFLKQCECMCSVELKLSKYFRDVVEFVVQYFVVKSAVFATNKIIIPKRSQYLKKWICAIFALKKQ